MVYVQCENPDCLHRLPKHEAREWHDSDGWVHWSCDAPVCITKAIVTVEMKKNEEAEFLEAIECCR